MNNNNNTAFSYTYAPHTQEQQLSHAIESGNRQIVKELLAGDSLGEWIDDDILTLAMSDTKVKPEILTDLLLDVRVQANDISGALCESGAYRVPSILYTVLKTGKVQLNSETMSFVIETGNADSMKVLLEFYTPEPSALWEAAVFAADTTADTMVDNPWDEGEYGGFTVLLTSPKLDITAAGKVISDMGGITGCEATSDELQTQITAETFRRSNTRAVSLHDYMAQSKRKREEQDAILR